MWRTCSLRIFLERRIRPDDTRTQTYTDSFVLFAGHFRRQIMNSLIGIRNEGGRCVYTNGRDLFVHIKESDVLTLARSNHRVNNNYDFFYKNSKSSWHVCKTSIAHHSCKFLSPARFAKTGGRLVWDTSMQDEIRIYLVFQD